MNRGCPASPASLSSFAPFESLESRRLLTAVLAADINRLPGSDYKPFEIKPIGNIAYFASHDGGSGMEVWRTDGASAFMVKDVFPGLGSSQPGGFTQAADGTVYFQADDGVHGYELWKTDGTAAGTVLVKDINPGPAISVPLNLTAMGNKVYFSADDGVHGREVWVSDGTAAGTQMLVDLRAGATGQNTNFTPLGMAAVNGTLFFGGNDGTRNGLWTSDGTVGSVTFVASVPQQVGKVMYTFDNRAYFPDRAGQFWYSDGTSWGTGGLPTSSNGGVTKVVVTSGALFYLSPSGTGRGVYRVPAGSTVATMLTGFTDPTDIASVGGDLYVSAYDATWGGELFRVLAGSTNGSLAVDVVPGTAGSFPTNLTGVGDALYFTTGNTTSGYTLYITRGTSASNVAGRAITAAGRAAPSLFTAVNGRLVFLNDDAASGQELSPRRRPPPPRGCCGTSIRAPGGRTRFRWAP